VLIAQISDCHLSADREQTYRGINPHQNLKAQMQKLKAMKPDLLLATGDLSEDGSRESYRLLKKYLHLPGVPVLALPGNHDDPKRLSEAFPGSPVDSIAVSDHGPWQIIRLNSCLPGKPEGHVDENALTELESHLSPSEQRPQLIAVHHQPIPVGNPWIDKYPLVNPERLLQLADRYPDVKAVIWGHIHHTFTADRNGTAMLGSPSSAINSLLNAQKFTPDPAGPACRWLELREDGTLRTGTV
jgi:Icc protein